MKKARKWRVFLVVILVFAGILTMPGIFAEDAVAKAMDQLKGLDEAVQAFYEATETYPALLDQLVQGPEEGKGGWQPLVAQDALMDPWGIPYIITLFDAAQAEETGLNYQISSAGPDKEFGTEDDLIFPANEPEEEAEEEEAADDGDEEE